MRWAGPGVREPESELHGDAFALARRDRQIVLGPLLVALADQAREIATEGPKYVARLEDLVAQVVALIGPEASAKAEAALENLDLTAIGAVQNSFDNTAHFGWYAQGRGAIALPTAASDFSARDYIQAGEQQGIWPIDLVNSLRLQFVNASGSSPDGTLDPIFKDPARSDVPEPPAGVEFLAAWDLNPNATLTGPPRE